jgi:glycosyltransferase involved in cell wall biosynthesis
MKTPAKEQLAVSETEEPWLSVVLPCFNEAEVIAETHRRVTAVCAAAGKSYELIVVNDGSTDGTLVKLKQLSRSDSHLVVINLSRNHGHQAALSAGLHFTRGSRILIMDADLQDPPELLPDMLQKMDAGADVVYAQRRTRFGDAPLKRFFCAVYYRLLHWLADTHIPLDTGDFRLISGRVRDLIVTMPERQRFIRGMVSWVGFRQEPILYDRDARFAGETKYPFSKLVALAVDGILSSSAKPLRFALPVGVAAISLSVVFGVYALMSLLFVSKTPQGWASTMAAIAFFGGFQLVVLGILGEYLGRIHEQTRGRPMFLVESVLRTTEEPPANGPK